MRVEVGVCWGKWGWLVGGGGGVGVGVARAVGWTYR